LKRVWKNGLGSIVTLQAVAAADRNDKGKDDDMARRSRMIAPQTILVILAMASVGYYTGVWRSKRHHQRMLEHHRNSRESIAMRRQ
jgi:hypothetical protein